MWIQEAYQQRKTQPNLYIVEIPNPIIKKYSVNFRWADAEITKLNTVKVSKEEWNVPKSKKIMGNLAGMCSKPTENKEKEGRVGIGSENIFVIKAMWNPYFLG